jgi:hypothetical protein
MRDVVLHCARRFGVRLAWISLTVGALIAAAG